MKYLVLAAFALGGCTVTASERATYTNQWNVLGDEMGRQSVLWGQRSHSTIVTYPAQPIYYPTYPTIIYATGRSYCVRNAWGQVSC